MCCNNGHYSLWISGNLNLRVKFLHTGSHVSKHKSSTVFYNVCLHLYSYTEMDGLTTHIVLTCITSTLCVWHLLFFSAPFIPLFLHFFLSLFLLWILLKRSEVVTMAKFGEAMRGLSVFITDIRNCESTMTSMWHNL